MRININHQVANHLETNDEGQRGQNQPQVEHVLVDRRHRHHVVVQIILFFLHRDPYFPRDDMEAGDQGQAEHRLNNLGRRVADDDLVGDYPLQPLVLLRELSRDLVSLQIGLDEHEKHEGEVDDEAASRQRDDESVPHSLVLQMLGCLPEHEINQKVDADEGNVSV